MELQLWLIPSLQDGMLYVDMVGEFLDYARETWRRVDLNLFWGFLKETAKDAWLQQSLASIAILSIAAIVVLYVLQTSLLILQILVKTFRVLAKVVDVIVSISRRVLWIIKLIAIPAFLIFVGFFAYTLYYDKGPCQFPYQEKFTQCQPS